MMNFDLSVLEPFMLVGMRVTGVVLTAPILSGIQLPGRVKAFFALALSLVLFGALDGKMQNMTGLPLTILLLKMGIEFLIGVGVGLAFRWAMSAAGMAGELMGLQMGIGIATTVDPTSGQGAVLTESLMTLTFGTLFLAFDGHHEVIRSLRASFEAVPPGGGSFHSNVVLQLIPQTMAMFGIGLRLAVVVMLPLFLVSIGLALVSRAFPQANIFSLGYSITLLLGLVLLASSGPALQAAVVQGIRSGTHDALMWTQGFIPR